ncbi:hypothetical protein MTO96_017025 [Rhipicephalus appendiculatus]
MTETMQPAADEKWVLLQHDGDTVKELLLEKQDIDAKGEKKNLKNAVQGQERAQDKENFLWWIRSTWNDVSVLAFTCIYEVCAGIKVFQEARAEEDFQWFPPTACWTWRGCTCL